MLYISNAFSLSMLPTWATEPVVDEVTGALVPPTGASLDVTPIADPAAYVAESFATGEEVVSAVGHADTAAIFSGILGIDVPINRTSITLGDNVAVLVGQYRGPRLPEGTTTLPEGAKIVWLLVEVL